MSSAPLAPQLRYLRRQHLLAVLLADWSSARRYRALHRQVRALDRTIR